ncbi:TatD family deoxyribonuclease [Rhizobium leguminosarum]|uniref:Qat anti-phage system TatD family nuclease QatD n=1 Tax=Rhizobium ruizarguesonis TaxID=2081791 RepID=UPI0013C1C250|nr:Qat anti-phage system TatD family nuclease QatD [Rhizobium ruizarguesonis]NEI19775.1 TatD family deoxyribonuclease [Rhizobium ruizarguesonis]
MIDTHCHLDLYPKPGTVIAEADKRGMFVIAVTTTPKAFLGNMRMTEGRKRIRVAVGLHPELVAERHREVEDVCQLMAKTKYIGEIGIDGSPPHNASIKLQTEVFARFLTRASQLGGKILSIHSRGAAALVLDEIEKNGDGTLPILHWFSGSKQQVERAVKLGCWFSVGPAMLRSRKGRELVACIPRHRLLTETDGPFATDGDRSLMPWDVSMALPVISDIWETTAVGVDQIVSANFRELINLADHSGTSAKLVG